MTSPARPPGSAAASSGARDDRYKWIASSNTTIGMFMATLDGSIVIISLPAIFRGIHLDPLAPGNIGFLLWMVMGYLLVMSLSVVTVGRLGDMFGRVRIYNLGFVVFTLTSLALSLDPFTGSAGALWLILLRLVQGFGGAMLVANSAAILTDAFPANERGKALGFNQMAGIAGQFIGLVAGGLLAMVDWRAVFWVNVPVGVIGTVWAYRSLREISTSSRGRIDWWGNIAFAAGVGAILVAITYGIQPYGSHSMGWTNPWVLTGLIGGAAMLAVFVLIETRVSNPMFHLSLFRIRTFTAGNISGFLAAISRGGMQFMLVIWLQGIWLPLHGYKFEDTPLWAGLFLLPLTFGYLITGSFAGIISDRFGARALTVGGMALFGLFSLGLWALPVNFSYPVFAVLVFLGGVGAAMFAGPNNAEIMSSVPANRRGAASGMRATFSNSGNTLSIGVFFTLIIIGLSAGLSHSLTTGLEAQGVPSGMAHDVGAMPPVAALFAAFLGVNPMHGLLQPGTPLSTLPQSKVHALSSNTFFPHVLSGPFHHALMVVFATAAVMAFLAALVSLVRGPKLQEKAAPVATPAATVAQEPAPPRG
ncbi:MFS transporter [Actinomadura rupiterrae]|uniref:MFS transporter n=1 Tax=Actinomadura rupiterrae TaxID=559627 RepID=UPI0020A5B289|nr:MFS transporter [Actinomadura rupiterrae]MCP2341504.1 MFS family permease [Actinomadura rupiterrae]